MSRDREAAGVGQLRRPVIRREAVVAARAQDRQDGQLPPAEQGDEGGLHASPGRLRAHMAWPPQAGLGERAGAAERHDQEDPLVRQVPRPCRHLLQSPQKRGQ